jgi:glycosyltransferase involved in cell wall biosynthesis
MHILHILFSKHLGGMERVFLDYTALLAEEHRVTCLTHPAFPDNAHVARLSHAHEHINPGNVHNPFTRRRLAARIRRIQPDLIVAHGNKALRLLTNTKRQAPLMGVNHSDNIRHSAGVDHLICVNPLIAERTIKAGVLSADNVTTIPNFIWCDHTAELPLRTVHQPFRLGALGRFTHEKGFDVLLDALSYCREAYPLYLGGDGVEHANLQAQARHLGITEQVHFLGWQTDIAQFFSQIDLLIVPSRHETFGLVILEAWKYGVPVIATKTDGPMLLIREGENGVLVEKDAPEPLAHAIDNSVKNLQQWESLRQEGYRVLTESYTQHHAQQLFDVLLRSMTPKNRAHR